MINKPDMKDVLNKYSIKLNNRNKAICPFHNEKTASFSVKGTMFYCFGCGEKGDSINFTMKIENCSFLEAIKILGCNEERQNRFYTVNNKREEKKREKYWEAYTQFAKYDLFCTENKPKKYQYPSDGWLMCNELRSYWWEKLQKIKI